MLAFAIFTCSGCSHSPSPEENQPPATTPAPNSSVDVKAVMDKYAALDTSHNSAIKLKAKIQRADGSSEQVEFTMYREHEADGSQHLLVEFTAPPEERDRDALINVSPAGDIEAIRYGQATKGFLTAKSPTDEESLFGLTLQELIGGEPEKYNYRLIGEETDSGTPVYRVEGALKPGAESRFPRLVMLIAKDSDTARLIEVYDSHDELTRKLIVDKTEQISGIWTRTKWTIDNIEQHKKVVFDAGEVKYNQNLPPSIFTKDHLKQIASK
ncbi:MAG TPA: outer membrane lipoprotein-sorting protein [Blastocatellia bacterium]|nr:outer membrane lipoprotein-sorting protein [Blastocatellia bacterium]